jgi:malonyl-CoA O-methyltransferase
MTSERHQVLAASFSRAAPDYRIHAEVQSALADWLAEWLPDPRSGRALELGAGPGLFTERLLPWTGEVLATDLSAAMCAAGRARLPDVAWAQAAAERPPRGPWDWIFASSMLQWVDDPVAVFCGWRDALAPGGRVLAGLFVAGSLPEWQSVAGAGAPLRWRAPEAWRMFLSEARLDLRRDEARVRGFTHPSARSFLRSVHGVGAAPSRRTSPAVLRRLLRDYERRHAVPGGVRSTWTFYRFEATRR